MMRAAKSFTSNGSSFGSTDATRIGGCSSALCRRCRDGSASNGANDSCSAAAPLVDRSAAVDVLGRIVGVPGLSASPAERMGERQRYGDWWLGEAGATRPLLALVPGRWLLWRARDDGGCDVLAHDSARSEPESWIREECATGVMPLSTRLEESSVMLSVARTAREEQLDGERWEGLSAIAALAPRRRGGDGGEGGGGVLAGGDDMRGGSGGCERGCGSARGDGLTDCGSSGKTGRLHESTERGPERSRWRLRVLVEGGGEEERERGREPVTAGASGPTGRHSHASRIMH